MVIRPSVRGSGKLPSQQVYFCQNMIKTIFWSCLGSSQKCSAGRVFWREFKVKSNVWFVLWGDCIIDVISCNFLLDSGVISCIL